MRTSSLGSWIDADALAAAAEGLARGQETDAEEALLGRAESGVWSGGRGLRARKVAVAGNPSDEEVSKARQKLESIRAQARHSGLIDRAVAVVESESPGALKDTPVAGEADAAEVAEEAGPFREAAEAAEASPEVGAEPAGHETTAKDTGAAEAGDAAVADTAEPAPYVIPQGTLGVRMGAFAAWVAEVTAGADVFVIDSQGYALVERGGNPDLMAAALLLGDASRRAAGQVTGGDGVVRMEVGGGKVLSVMACETQYGTLCICVHGDRPVEGATGDKLVAALRMTLGV